MRRFFVPVLAAALFTIPASAHVNDFLAFQWPDHVLPKIDGDLSEWAIVPDAYAIRIEDSFNALPINREINKADLDFVAWAAYNDAQDVLYLAGWVFDDIHVRDSNDCTCNDDSFEFVVDSDHSLDRDSDTTSGMQWWNISVPPLLGKYMQTGPLSNTWVNKPPHFQFGWSFEGDQFGEGTYYYEMRFAVWDELNPVGADLSTAGSLDEGDIIHLNLSITDDDTHLGLAKRREDLIYGDDAGYWTTDLTNVNARYWTIDRTYANDGYWTIGDSCCDSENSPDFLLAPLEEDLFTPIGAMDGQTWPRLSSSLP